MTPDSRTLEAIISWLYEAALLADQAVETKARLILLDTLGCFIASLRHDVPASLLQEISDHESGFVHLPGTKQPLSPASAAFVVAVGACWDEACEGLARAHGRPGLHASPVALALTLAKDGTLRDVLDALVVGYEMGGRMGEALRIRPGMHVDGAWGAMAAAAAGAKALSDDPNHALHAVQIAACQIPFSLYAPVAAGATARNTYVGHGAALGLRSAQAAVAGVSAPAAAVNAYAELALRLDPPKIIFAPPGEFLILEGYLKPFAAVRHVHYGAACALDWRRRFGAETASIEALSLEIYSEAIQYCDNRAPAKAIQAQFSLTYGLSHTLVTGNLGPDAYSDAALADPETRRLESLISLRPAPALDQAGRRGAKLGVRHGGNDSETSVAGISGDPDRPLGVAEIEAKFTAYAEPVMGRPQARVIADKLLRAPLDSALRSLFDLTTAGSAK